MYNTYNLKLGYKCKHKYNTPRVGGTKDKKCYITFLREKNCIIL